MLNPNLSKSHQIPSSNIHRQTISRLVQNSLCLLMLVFVSFPAFGQQAPPPADPVLRDPVAGNPNAIDSVRSATGREPRDWSRGSGQRYGGYNPNGYPSTTTTSDPFAALNNDQFADPGDTNPLYLNDPAYRNNYYDSNPYPAYNPGYNPNYNPGNNTNYNSISNCNTCPPYGRPGYGYNGNCNGDYYNPNDPRSGCYGLRRLLETLSVDALWLTNGDEANSLSLTRLDLSTRLRWRPTPHPRSRFMVEPGFAFNWWSGPDYPSLVPDDPLEPVIPSVWEMPAQTYDAYLNFLWQAVLTPNFIADINVKVGVYSDFQKADGHSLRVTGAGYARFLLTDSWELKIGVEYINRVDVKLLPAGGLIWTSLDKQTKIDLLFPTPKFSRRCEQANAQYDLWWYVRGEYGGGTWAILHENDIKDVVSYNDIKISFGIDFNTIDRFRGYFEIGGAFDRELDYKKYGTVGLKSAFFLAGGVYY